MIKLNQKGFGVVAVVIIIAAISLFGFGGYYVYSQNSGEELTDTQENAQTNDGTLEPKDTAQANDETGDTQESTQTDDSSSESDLNIARRDLQRQSDLGTLIANSENYAANHNGSYPAAYEVKSGVIDTFITKDFFDPLLNVEYVIVTQAAPQLGEIQYELGKSCDNKNELVEESSERYLATRALLENGDFFCQDNS